MPQGPPSATMTSSRFVIQVNGPGTNSYLLYSTKTKEVAVIDIGGELSEVLPVIETKGLDVKYILMYSKRCVGTLEFCGA